MATEQMLWTRSLFFRLVDSSQSDCIYIYILHVFASYSDSQMNSQMFDHGGDRACETESTYPTGKDGSFCRMIDHGIDPVIVFFFVLLRVTVSTGSNINVINYFYITIIIHYYYQLPKDDDPSHRCYELGRSDRQIPFLLGRRSTPPFGRL